MRCWKYIPANKHTLTLFCVWCSKRPLVRKCRRHAPAHVRHSQIWIPPPPPGLKLYRKNNAMQYSLCTKYSYPHLPSQGHSQILNLGWAREEHFLIFSHSSIIFSYFSSFSSSIWPSSSPTRVGPGHVFAPSLPTREIVMKPAYSVLIKAVKNVHTPLQNIHQNCYNTVNFLKLIDKLDKKKKKTNPSKNLELQSNNIIT